MPIKDTTHDFGPSFITTNPNNEEWRNRLCENTNQAGINIGIPFMCDPTNNAQNENNNVQNENNNAQNENNIQHGRDISDKVHEKIENLKEKIDDSIFGNNERDNSLSNSVQSNSESDNKKEKDNNNAGNGNINNNGDNDNQQENSEQQLSEEQGTEFNYDNSNGNNDNQQNTNDGNNANIANNQGNNDDNQGNNDEDGLGISGLGLDLNIDKKLGKVDEKIDNLKNNLGVGQQEKKDKEENNNDQGNDDTLGITALTPNVLNIQANLDKQIEKLKDKFENEKDNQRLVDQRNEFDDDEDDTKDSDDGDDGGDGKDYDGYGFKGDDDNGNGHEDGEENFNFAAAGDFGCSTNTQNTIENMQSKDPEIVLTLGDLSYHSTADCWFDMMSPVKDKLMLTLGYHDVEDGQAKMNQYMNSFALEKPFYSYDYNKVHFLVMSAKSVYYKGSEQYNFVEDDLKKASENENVNWIVVSSYGPPYTSPSEHTAFKELREVYHPIFEKYGVDLVLGGHNHNYQRTYPLTYNPNDSGEPKVTSTSTGEYDGQKDGIVFAIVGTGGVNLYPFTGQAPFVEKQFDNKFGYLNIDITNGNPHSKLIGTFYDNKGGQILDQFTIDKDLKSKTTEVVSS
ncbi:MAG TPA: metallophosphoesterase [Nitrososphaeraceae archaeon]|nr:metallophosphoesterase [Nitrososphaeraceae archaeon]